MNGLTLPREAEQEALRRFYAAVNRNDVAAAVEPFDQDIEWIEPAENPGAGTTRGRTNLQAHIAYHRGNWAEGGCEPVRFIAAGDKVVSFVHVRVRLKGAAEWIEGEHAEVYTFRNGKAVQKRLFTDTAQALETARAATVNPD